LTPHPPDTCPLGQTEHAVYDALMSRPPYRSGHYRLDRDTVTSAIGETRARVDIAVAGLTEVGFVAADDRGLRPGDSSCECASTSVFARAHGWRAVRTGSERDARRSRRSARPRPDDVVGWTPFHLACYFRERMAEPSVAHQRVYAANVQALAGAFRSWGMSPEVVKAMIDEFAIRPDKYTRPGAAAWRAFIHHREWVASEAEAAMTRERATLGGADYALRRGRWEPEEGSPGSYTGSSRSYEEGLRLFFDH
jgi:hypothetical protein